jgi:proteasome accessory factor A
MAIRKVCGLETEYGIILRGAESNPITVSSLLINAYVSALARQASGTNKVGWAWST